MIEYLIKGYAALVILFALICFYQKLEISKGFVIELISPYIQNAWRSKVKMVWIAELIAYCNYL